MPFRTLCVLITHYRNPLLTQIFTFGLVEFSRSQQVWFTRAAVAAMGDRLVTIGTSRKVGVVPLWEGSWVPILHNVAWAETYLHTKWHPNPSSRFTTIDTGQKLGAAIPLFGGGELGPLPHNVVWSEAYLFTMCHLKPSSRLATTDMAKNWGQCPFLGELGSHLTQCNLDRVLSLYQLSSWSIQTFGHNTPKWQTEDRHDWQRFDSIGRTVLQTVAQKTYFVSFTCSADRSDNFIVGLTDVSPATTAPTLWNYVVCAQYPGVVGQGATVYLPCTACMPPRRYLIVQVEVVNQAINFCEIGVYVRGKLIWMLAARQSG